MTSLSFRPIPTAIAKTYWTGAADAYGMKPERQTSDGEGVPCRHCLSNVASGDSYLILAYCPFPERQPYAEIGPIFLHAKQCLSYSDNASIPPSYLRGKSRILRGYDTNNRIIYGTGKVVEPDSIEHYAQELLNNPDVHYVHVRSSENNCYAFRIDRAK